MLWEVLLLIPDSHTGEPDMALSTLIPTGKPLQYNYFRLWVPHPVGMGFDYIMKTPLLPSCYGILFVFGCRFFKKYISVLSVVVQQLVMILMFLWEEVSSSSTFPSCLPSIFSCSKCGLKTRSTYKLIRDADSQTSPPPTQLLNQNLHFTRSRVIHVHIKVWDALL